MLPGRPNRCADPTVGAERSVGRSDRRQRGAVRLTVTPLGIDIRRTRRNRPTPPPALPLLSQSAGALLLDRIGTSRSPGAARDQEGDTES